MTESLVDIRGAIPADAKKLNQYMRTIFSTSDHLITTIDEFRMKPMRQRLWIAQKATNPYETCLVATRNNDIVGMLDSWTDTRKRVRHVTTFSMSVHPEARRQGIGARLLQHYLSWVDENPRLHKIELHVHADNSAACALYSKLGFTNEGTRKAAIQLAENQFVDDVLMAYWPTPSLNKSIEED